MACLACRDVVDMPKAGPAELALEAPSLAA